MARLTIFGNAGLTLTHSNKTLSCFEFAASRIRDAGRIAGKFVLTLIVSSGLVSCNNFDAGLDDDNGLTSSWVRPIDPQDSIGKKEHPMVLAKYGGEYSDPKAERMIAVIVGRLVAVSDDPARVYKITLLNSPKVNAFALPGGYLYVTRGLLALANDSSEIAAVIAHEMAHVSSNHAILRQSRVNSAAIGEKVVSEVLTDSTAGKFAIAANKMRLSKFSQEQELQADTIGIRMIGKAGYDPYAAERFLKIMQKYRGFLDGESSFEDSENFVSSHPSTPKRIRLARQHARFFGAPGIGNRETSRYFEGIDGMLYGDTAEEGFVRGNTFSHAGLGISFQAPNGFRIENQPKAVIVSGPNDIATRFDATVLSKNTNLKDYLKSGWLEGLVDETVREEQLNGLASATALARGEGWRFKVRVIRSEGQVYRFITAAPQTNSTLDAVSRKITSSFRVLSKREIANLKPLTIKVVKVGGQSEADLVRRMRGTDRPAELFRLLNGLDADSRLQSEQQVKLVTDQ